MKFISYFLGLFIAVSVQASQLEISRDSEFSANARYSYNFGTVWVNQRSTVSYTLKNTGTTPLTFEDAYIYGSDFSARHSCNKIVMPNDKCGFEISYWPLFEGFDSGQFVLSFTEDRIIVDLWGQARRM